MAFANQNQGSNFPVYPQLIDPRTGNPPFPFFINLNPNNAPFFVLPNPNPNPLPFYVPSPEFAQIDKARTDSLLKFMADEGLLPSPEEEIKRQKAIQKLKEIVMEWIQNVAQRKGVGSDNIKSVSATILTYGSYGLGVHNSDSDIDALCVGPSFASLEEDFFVVLRDMLTRRPEVSEVNCIKEARVPLMKFKLDGISIDLPYSRLKVTCVPENVDILNPFFLKDIDATSWRSLSGVHANKCILRLVPNLEVYQSLLRCIKFWSKRRGVYGHLLGFFGGIHLAILAAYVCQRHPTSSLTILMTSFFLCFSSWPWTLPVSLRDGLPRGIISAPDPRNLMPIRLPCKPHEYCHSNAAESNFCRIKQELSRGHLLCKDWFKPDFDWASLFESFPYSKIYTRFLRICLSASDQDQLREWTCLTKSRFPTLLLKLEQQVYGLCDPNPTEYGDISVLEPNTVFCWGLPKTGYVDIKYLRDFLIRSLRTNHHGPNGTISLSVIQASLVPGKDAPSDTKSCLCLKGSLEKLSL